MIHKTASAQRLVQLDSLRGIAAMAVVIVHLFEVFPVLYGLVEGRPVDPSLYLLAVPPLYLFWAGHTAVLLFFLLSGFVLAIPFLESRGDQWSPVAYRQYMMRRVCRIYLPYLMCIVTCSVLSHVTPANPLDGLSQVMRDLWTQPPTLEIALQHLLLIGNLDPSVYNGVIWTLTYEMRISIVFPVIAWMVYRLSGPKALAAALGIGLAGLVVTQLFRHHHHVASHTITIWFAAIFMAGATLAKYRRPLVERLERLSGRQYTAAVVVMLLLCSAESVKYVTGRSALSHPLEVVALTGASLAILLSLTSRVMLLAPLVLLGKVSFSLYLWHMPVLMTVLRLGYGRVTMWVLIPLAIGGSLLAAEVMHRWVELPAMRLSKRFRTRPQVEETLPTRAPALAQSAAVEPA